MTGRDITNIKRLVEWIAEHADYGDITELCKKLKVPEDWFEKFYNWEDESDE